MARDRGHPGAPKGAPRGLPGGGATWVGRNIPNGPVKINGPSPIVNLEMLRRLNVPEVKQDVLYQPPTESVPEKSGVGADAVLAKIKDSFFNPLNPMSVRNWDYSIEDVFNFVIINPLPQVFTIGNGVAGTDYVIPEGHVLVITSMEFYAKDATFLEIPRRQLTGCVSFRPRTSSTSGLGEFTAFAILPGAAAFTQLVGQTIETGSVGPYGMPEFARFYNETIDFLGEYTVTQIPPMLISRVGIRASGYLIGSVTIDKIRGATT